LTQRPLVSAGIALDSLLAVQDDFAVVALEALRVPVLVQSCQPLSRRLAFLGGDGFVAAGAPGSVFLVVAFLTKQFVVWVGGESDVLVGEVLLADGALEAGGVKGHTHRPDHLAPDLFFANVTP